MDICLILLILIVVVSALIIYHSRQVYAIPTALAIGGAVVNKSNTTKSLDRSKQLLIGDSAKLVVDGHNMIHELLGKANPTIDEFEDALCQISDVMTTAYPTQDVHIVVKNPSASTTKAYNRIKNSKTLKTQKQPAQIKKKKSSEERIPYFRELVALSKKHPRITYHLAYGKESKKADVLHYLKSRDDFLTIYLAKGHYMISKDRFKDFKQFAGIKPFKHYSVTDGVIHPKETIYPLQQYTNLEKPSVGNHFIFQLLSEKDMNKLKIKNGDIYLTDGSVFGCMYLQKR